LDKRGLVLGNGDLNALLYERHGALCLRISKNDIWDARVDTSADPPLLKVDVPNQKWSGGGGNIPSWGKPYPTPRTAAIVNIGAAGAGVWQCIRAQGKVNEWLRRDDAGIMAIEGKAEASAAYRWNIVPVRAEPCSSLRFKIAGTGGARYYVNIFDPKGECFVASGWRDTPETEQDVVFPLNRAVSALELYIMTKAGARAENRIREITLTADAAPLLLTAGLIGAMIAARATFSAEVGGCMAECGSGSGMAAAALVGLAGGNLDQQIAAASLALQNIFGMICDPIGNRVEAPCLGKNVMGAVNALACANMALAGYRHLIPLDEVIETMDRVGKSIPRDLRCTGLGGLSITPSAKRIQEALGNAT
jgi:hypothetical protein